MGICSIGADETIKNRKKKVAFTLISTGQQIQWIQNHKRFRNKAGKANEASWIKDYDQGLINNISQNINIRDSRELCQQYHIAKLISELQIKLLFP